ncbi:zinc/cadmium/mercury/lead-transporting ATPase [Kalamiella sp. sgz302252]|uniref:zinc/cadmium/mercury/lead-transporting ATPase n=1 Tax=Pantoea sp. sgz302252 TaxID=3341827 RepID=UPI0036D3E8B5
MHQNLSSSCPCGQRHAVGQKDCRPASGVKLAAAKKTCCGANSCTSPSETQPHSGDYSWQISGMDCPGCARKIENAVGQLAGVTQARVLFATEKLVVNADRDVRQQVENAVARAGFTLRSAAQPAREKEGFWQENGMLMALAGLMVASWLLQLFNPQAGKIAFILTTLAGCWPVARTALRLTRSGTPFAIETLMTVAAVGALFIGATAEAAMVLLLFMLGERLEAFAAGRARRGVTALMALKPEQALRIRGDIGETVAVDALRPGDIIEVAAGGRLPADASLVTPFASFDESALTGESMPVERQAGESIAAGSLSVDRLVRLKVVSKPGESAIDRILHLIEEADAHRAPVERFLDRFSRVYTPLVMAVALLTALVPPLLFAADWQSWIYKGLTLLLIGCPCALVISTPAAITSGLAAAARHGVLIKGGAALEILNGVRTLAFDKTGTLTEGKPQIVMILAFDNEDETVLLAKAAAVERGSSHPLAKAVVQLAEQRRLIIPQATAQRALAGSGIEAVVGDHKLLICAPGQRMLIAERQAQVAKLESAGNTVVIVVQNEQPIGLIALRDTLRPDAAAALAELRALNIEAVMLTGDNPRAAAAIASELAIDYQAGLLPEDKVAAIHELNQQSAVAMVGDGINDAPAMKAATLGIAMGGGSDVALESADAALTHNRLAGLATMIRLARATHANIRQNITLALGLKSLFLVTTLLGITGLWLAVLADSGATALVTANALRLLSKR